MFIRAKKTGNAFRLSVDASDDEILRVIDALEIATTPGREIDQHTRMTLYNFRAELNEATGMVVI